MLSWILTRKLLLTYSVYRVNRMRCSVRVSDTGPDLNASVTGEEPSDQVADTSPSTPPSTPVPVDMAEEVLRMPIYLEFARRSSLQVNMLVEVVLAMSADGKFVQATATCDEVDPPFPRVGGTRHLSMTSDASIYVPSNIMYAPVYVVVRKIRGINLHVSWYCTLNEDRLTRVPFQKRIAIQLTFFEWLPGDRSSLEVIADIKLLSEGVMVATRYLYVGDAYNL